MKTTPVLHDDSKVYYSYYTARKLYSPYNYAPNYSIVPNSAYKWIRLLGMSRPFFFITGMVLGAFLLHTAMHINNERYNTASLHKISPLLLRDNISNNKYDTEYPHEMKAIGDDGILAYGSQDLEQQQDEGVGGAVVLGSSHKNRGKSAADRPLRGKTDKRNHGRAGDEKREFRAYGSGAALFAMYGAYRGAHNSFAVVGLGSKPLYAFGEPEFECYWEPLFMSSSNGVLRNRDHARAVTKGVAKVMLPDVGYGRVYTTVVLNCTFNETVAAISYRTDDGTSVVEGGQLVVYASAGRRNDPLVPEAPPAPGAVKRHRIVALREVAPYDTSAFEGPPNYPYEIVYCGSPLFGDLNEERIREWMAYHVRLFGPRSHFVLQNAGGIHSRVRAVLEPWQRRGYLTILDVQAEAEFDSHYHNQFLLLNDCLHRTRFLANWTFFFDVDEFIYIAPELSLQTVLSWHANDTVLSFQQLRMSNAVCIPAPAVLNSSGGGGGSCHGSTGRTASAGDVAAVEQSPWMAMERLAYGELFGDSKYAVQARHVYATGVHSSQAELGHMEGSYGWAWWPHMRFYHYHDTISRPGHSLCTHTSTNSTFTLDGHTYTLDTSMLPLAPLIRSCFQHTTADPTVTPPLPAE